MADADLFSIAGQPDKSASGGGGDLFSMAGGSSPAAVATPEPQKSQFGNLLPSWLGGFSGHEDKPAAAPTDSGSDIFSTAASSQSSEKMPLDYQAAAKLVAEHDPGAFEMKPLDPVVKTATDWLGTQINRPGAAISGAVQAGIEGKNPVQGAAKGFTTDNPAGWGGVIASADKVPQVELPWYAKAAGAMGDVALNPLNVFEFGALTKAGMEAEKTANLTGTLGGDAAAGYRSAAAVNVPFTKTNLPLMPQSASKAVLGGVSKAADFVKNTPIPGTQTSLNQLFSTSAGLSPEMAKSKILNYEAPLNELDHQRIDLLKAHQKAVNDASAASGLTPQEVHEQILRYNEATTPEMKAMMKEEMHPAVSDLADQRQKAFDMVQKKDSSMGLAYTPRTNYEPHNPTSEFLDYLSNNPKAQAVFNAKHGPSIPREVSGSILENNAMTQAGKHPNYKGFTGKMFEDDLSKTYSDRLAESRKFEITKNFFKNVTDQYGKTPEEYEKLVADGKIGKRDMVPMSSRAFGQDVVSDAAGKQRTVNRVMYLPPQIKANLTASLPARTASMLDAIKPVNAAWRKWQISSPSNAFRDIFVAYPKNASLKGVQPPTMLRNFVRNLPMALENAGFGEGLGNGVKMLADGRQISGPELLSELRQMAYSKGLEGTSELDKAAQVGENRGSALSQLNPLKAQNWQPMIDEWKASTSKIGNNLAAGGAGNYLKAGAQAVAAPFRAISQNPYFNAYRTLRTPIENAMRGAYYMALREGKGFSKNAAILDTKDTMYHWEDLTPFQKNVVREVEPFAVWGMKNLPFQVEQILKNPAKAMAIQRFMTGYGGPQQNNEKRFYSDWQTKAAPLRVGGEKPGENPTNVYLGNWDPTLNVNDFAPTGATAGDFANPGNWAKSILNYNLDQLTPALKLPYDLIQGRDSYFNQKLENYPGEKVPFMGMSVSPAEKEVLSEWMPFVFANRLMTKPGAQTALRALTDINAQPFDVEKEGFYKEKDLKKEVSGLRMEQRKQQQKLDDPKAPGHDQAASNLAAISARLGALARGAKPESEQK